MNLKITGIHLEVTPSLREYIEAKLERITRHVDNVTSVAVTLSVEKLEQKAEVNVHLKGKDIHVEATSTDMYAALDALADKLDRQVLKHKEKITDHHSAERAPTPATDEA
ncbi:ribosome hibernation-promoting factor, HPF/YfiA family [Rivihabitans pingtungensis]|jgi:putative sigma-54 modulation protein|uniref:Ribosome hibernation promoting factor n=1 Tax=Rivihabitans pingtungensis TaxID=1054498 RepID=A0A318KM63_9NEIS|nr:ribosome-associated translation inhibitor RaiA [Rivihabitans pingtungensis]MCK6437807.1 ribosome-associated translation inhibitor RaiA [Rivihabitans pingtungensis]PXX78871.1 SSU ribosomal protein S30P /sigma 54 modulation protein [Rivihabitans pingtungensis]